MYSKNAKERHWSKYLYLIFNRQMALLELETSRLSTAEF